MDLTDAQLIESQQNLIDRYEAVLESIATMLDDGIIKQMGDDFAWENWADHSSIPADAILAVGARFEALAQTAWAAREEANAALTFEREESGVEG